jgi:two-component system, OmpR family, phosphate regulon response regulator PhoB
VTRILLVEDDATLGATLVERLCKEGYDAHWAKTLVDATRTFDRGLWDLAILDVGLPDGSGFDFARRIRAFGSTPIMFMTAASSAQNRLEGFEIGAEEFLPKPFHLKELFIRIRHILDKRSTRHVVPFGARSIDLDAMAVIHPDGTREFPQARDFKILRMLIEWSPRVVSRDAILDRIWGEDRFPAERTVDNAIVRLRHAVGDTAIRSVRGVGYQWSPIEGA